MCSVANMGCIICDPAVHIQRIQAEPVALQRTVAPIPFVARSDFHELLLHAAGRSIIVFAGLCAWLRALWAFRENRYKQVTIKRTARVNDMSSRIHRVLMGQ